MAAPLQIAIIGGGLGGLTLALTLGKAQEEGANIKVCIYEAASAFAEIGAGVSIGRNAVRVLEALGMKEEYAKIADFSEAAQGEAHKVYFEWRRYDNGKAIGRTIENHHSYVHRARFLDTILAAVPTCVERKFSKRLTNFSSENDAMTLTFEDGTVSHADCVIGCDGIKSALRASLHPPRAGAAEIRYSGSYCYRGLIDAKTLMAAGYKNPTLPAMYLGPQKHILAFPVDHGKTVNVVAFVSDRSLPYNERKWNGHPRIPNMESPAPWVTPVDQHFMLEDYEGWNDQVQILLRHIDKPSCWALHELTDLDRWTFGRVALMGDAASATTPHQGSGAGQAIESGYVIGKLLSLPTCNKQNVEDYLKVYEQVRKPRHDRVKNTSRENGEVFELCGFGSIDPVKGKKLAWDESEEGWNDLAIELEHRLDWIFDDKIEKQIELALSKVQ